MNSIMYEWDENKNRLNQRKHGITFEEASTVFDDAEALVIPDPAHSRDEERFIILGISQKPRLLVVCHCMREYQRIRLISARKATTKEAKQYHDQITGR